MSASEAGNRHTDPVIICRDVVRTFDNGGETVVAVDELSVEFAAGEMTAVVGPSGSGKTTLLNLLAAIDYPTSGEIEAGGTLLSTLSVTEQADYRATTASIVHCDHNLLPMMTVYENLSLSLSLRRLAEVEVDRRITEALDATAIGELADRLPGNLSAGQRARAALARALAMGTEVIVADEPTSHLDHPTAVEIAAVLRDLAEGGVCVIVATHDPSVWDAAHRVVRLVDGRLDA
jgi:putative ABC transport system ATP-binding protein